MNRAFAVDNLVFERDQIRRVTSIRPEISQIVLEGQQGEEFVLSIDEFHTRVAQGQYRWKPGHPASDLQAVPVRNLTQTERSTLDQRLEVMELVEQAREEGQSWSSTIERLRTLCEERTLPLPSTRTLQRWRKSSALSCASDQLAPYYSARGNKRRFQTLDDLDFEEIVTDEIYRGYCQTDKFNLSQITKLVNHACRVRAEQRNVPFRGISRRSVTRRVRALEQTLLAPGRVSKATYHQEMRAAVRKFEVERPYDRVEVDATPLDVFCCDEKGVVIGRPTCYAGIDAATGAIVTIKCSIQKPSQDFVLSAVEFCFTPKGPAFSEKYQLDHAWLAPASIVTMVLDNAQEHHGGVVLNALRYLNTTIDYPMAGKPQAKPYIERFFGTLKTGLINTLPGSTKSQSPMERDPIGRAVKERLYTVPALEALIIKWVSDVYMRTPLRRLSERFEPGCSPSRAMELLKQRHIVIPPPDPEQFRNACMRYSSREMTLSREGVCLETMTFNSDELSKLYQARGPKTKVRVRFYPLDCRSIYIADPADDTRLIEAYNREPAMPMISFEDARLIRRNNGKSDAVMSGEDYQIAHMKILQGIRARAANGRMKDRNLEARSNELEQRREEAQRGAPPTPTVEPALFSEVLPQQLSAAPRRKKPTKGGAQ